MPTCQTTRRRVIQNDMARIHGFIALVYTVTAQCLAIAWTGEWALSRRDGAYGIAVRAEPAISP